MRHAVSLVYPPVGPLVDAIPRDPDDDRVLVGRWVNAVLPALEAAPCDGPHSREEQEEAETAQERVLHLARKAAEMGSGEPRSSLNVLVSVRALHGFSDAAVQRARVLGSDKSGVCVNRSDAELPEHLTHALGESRLQQQLVQGSEGAVVHEDPVAGGEVDAILLQQVG